jgi:hypothetical protein
MVSCGWRMQTTCVATFALPPASAFDDGWVTCPPLLQCQKSSRGKSSWVSGGRELVCSEWEVPLNWLGVLCQGMPAAWPIQVHACNRPPLPPCPTSPTSHVQVWNKKYGCQMYVH